MFVKENIGKFKHLPPTQRIRECAKLYREMKGKQMPAKKGDKGGSLFGSFLPSILGLGLDTKKKAKKAMPRMRKAKGGTIVTPTMTSSGAGLEDLAQGFLEHVGPFAHLLL